MTHGTIGQVEVLPEGVGGVIGVGGILVGVAKGNQPPAFPPSMTTPTHLTLLTRRLAGVLLVLLVTLLHRPTPCSLRVVCKPPPHLLHLTQAMLQVLLPPSPPREYAAPGVSPRSLPPLLKGSRRGTSGWGILTVPTPGRPSLISSYA